VHTLHDAEFGLLARSVAALRSLVHIGLLCAAPLAGAAEQHLVANRELVFELEQKLLLIDATTRRRAQLLLQLENLTEKAFILALEQLRCRAHLRLVHGVQPDRHRGALHPLDQGSRLERLAAWELGAQVTP